MIKEDLVKKIALEFNLSLNLTARVVQTLFDEIVHGLASDSRIELRRFGVFGIKHQAPRVITLPSGKKITRPAQRVVTFNPSITVKKKLNPAGKPTRRNFHLSRKHTLELTTGEARKHPTTLPRRIRPSRFGRRRTAPPGKGGFGSSFQQEKGNQKNKR